MDVFDEGLNNDVWFSWLISCLALASTIAFGFFFSNETFHMWIAFDVVTAIFRIFLGQGYCFMARKPFHRIVLLFILLLSTIMNFLFVSRMRYLLNGLNYLDSVSSFVQVNKTASTIGAESYFMLTYIREILEFDDSKQYIDCFRKNEYCWTNYENENTALFYNVRRARKYLYELNDYKRNQKEWIQLNPPVMTERFTAIFPKGSPMCKLFDKYLRYLLEAGIIDKISEKYYGRSFTPNKFYGMNTVAEKLNMSHMVAPGYIVISGLLFGFLVFVLEIFVNFVNENKDMVRLRITKLIVSNFSALKNHIYFKNPGRRPNSSSTRNL